MTIIINLIPIFMVLFSITVFRRSTRTSMLIGAAGAVLISLSQGYPVRDIGHLVQTLLISTVRDNWALFSSLLVFGMFVYTITHSDAVPGLSVALRSLTSSRIGFIACVIGCILICSSDDYLDCIIVCMALTTCAAYYGINSIRFSVLVNMLVASACTLLPSTWQPVISGSLASAGISNIHWQWYAFFPIISFFLVIGYALFGSSGEMDAQNATTSTEHAVANEERANTRIAVAGILISTVTLAVSFVFLNLLGFEYALLTGSTIALVITAVFFTRFDLIHLHEMRGAWLEGVQTMGSLDITLVTIWLFTGLMTDLLHIDHMIVDLLQQFQVPVWMLPMIYYIGSAVFSFLTSSAFASFRVMVPLAAASASLLSNNDVLSAMIIGATISGSLFASLSLTSDTLILSTQSAGCDIRAAFLMQCRYTIVILLLGSMAYCLTGLLTITTGNSLGIIGGYLAILVCSVIISAIYGRLFHD